ncbi:MAG: flagellar hook capping FlgD N-terminal domain-containing protein [Sedimentibacter sp.]|uniref:flagellar hook assembly protein FlgD n=1 Tax=Sedimentibacter sp. TaxID=1960295 RepID=UPI0029823D94|nr:flagellar hook capping FlgD N-terminal domain-containing protein [Sedimentibacter sp.]MDW5298745.1 flagellar hook capping FlgD N-terminal domain-containing protein [Sedimentibacter sp.]
MEINAYNNYVNSTGSTSNLNVQSSSESLDMQDFLDLLVAQMTNQDVMNPMENTEFISQMAQFSSLQAMSNLSDISMQGQATSLIGKNVVVASYDSQGNLVADEGVVQRVTIHSGETKLYVNDIEYSYSNVMEIKQTSETDPMQELIEKVLEGINSINDALGEEEINEISAVESVEQQ